jgi:hypothetical protein
VPGGRGLEAGWVRLARAAQAGGAALLVSSPYRVSGTAAAVVVAARPGRALRAVPTTAGATSLPLFAGLAGRFRLDKSRGKSGGEEAVAELTFAAALPAGARPAAPSALRPDLRPDARPAAPPVPLAGGAAWASAHPVAGPLPDAVPFPLADRAPTAGPATGGWEHAATA